MTGGANAAKFAASLGGVLAPLTAPFDAEERLALPRLRENIRRYNQTKLSGYVINGSTGESVLLRWDEVEQLWAAAREETTPEKLLVAGTGAESTRETIEMTKRAAEIGCDAALVRTPSFYKPQLTEELQAEHFLRVAGASPIPVLIYSVPNFTGYTVEAPLVERLTRHPNIVGMKDSSGDAARAQRILAAVPAEFHLLVGSATLLASAMREGAAGAILAMACVFPELCAEIYEAAQQGDTVRAGALQEKLSRVSAVVMRHGIPGIKLAMELRGYYGGPARRPLLPLAAAGKAEIEAVMASALAQSAGNGPAAQN
jgi:4-hydroxy-2-oxoglutarate aldolase